MLTRSPHSLPLSLHRGGLHRGGLLLGGLCLGALCLGAFACAPAEETPAEGPVGAALQLAADESGLSRDLLVAIAVEEDGLRLAPRRRFQSDDHVPVAGHLQLRHGGFDSLTRAAELAGVSEQVLVEDTELATRAAALVLAELGRALVVTDDLASWAPALERLSGLGEPTQRSAYAHRVLERLVSGGRFTAFAGERVILRPHAELSLPNLLRQALGGPSQFPGATWIETSCTNKCNVGRDGVSVDTIVIHDTEGGWNASVATLQSDPGKSAHYLIDADGSRVAQFRPESDITWHSGNAVYNGRSVGIEHVGYIDDPAGFAPALYETSATLVASIRTRHTIPLDRQHIIGHYQVPDGGQIAASSQPCADPLLSCLSSTKYGGASNHSDPGPRWQWCQYMQRLGGSCACNDTFMNFNCTTDRKQAVRCVNGSVEIRTCAAPCEVQSLGVPDLCDPIAPGSTKAYIDRVSRRAIATLVAESPVDQPPKGGKDDAPVDAPGPTPGAEATGGCAMSGHAVPSGWQGALVALAVLLRRTRRRELAAG